MTKYEKVYANLLYKFSKIMERYKQNEYSQIIFLCIGSSKIIGDSFGPLVGNKLKQKISSKDIIVVGDLKNNICALNIDKNIEIIKNNYKKPLIIAIDAALSRNEDIGKIKIYPYGIKIRKALDDEEKIIGDLSIKAVVANNKKIGISNYIELKETPYDRIEYLSDILVTGINEVIKNSNV